MGLVEIIPPSVMKRPFPVDDHEVALGVVAPIRPSSYGKGANDIEFAVKNERNEGRPEMLRARPIVEEKVFQRALINTLAVVVKFELFVLAVIAAQRNPNAFAVAPVVAGCRPH